MDLLSLGHEIAARRKALGLTQPELARRARVGRSTLAALENGALRELGFNRTLSILAALKLELRLTEANAGRPTLEDLQRESDR